MSKIKKPDVSVNISSSPIKRKLISEIKGRTNDSLIGYSSLKSNDE